MTFTVTWKPSAIEALATLWLDSARRDSVSKAADEIDGLLRERPLGVGEPALLNSRILVCLPLAVVYDVQVDDRLVQVLMVAAIPGE
jgi:hypothetical protein